MTEKEIQLNLEDENAGKIAEIITNKTCKKILSIIADNDKELSETDIASKLDLPLNTVDYNIKKLLEAGLIEENKSFFWSVKGKKIKTFKLANKKIIISTKPRPKGLISMILSFGFIAGFVKLFMNVLNETKDIGEKLTNNIQEDNLLETSKGVSDAGLASESSPISGLINWNILFNDVALWIILGVSLGILLFFIYRLLKTK
jgi:DNA-binding transcriptional ArsR family regulator